MSRGNSYTLGPITSGSRARGVLASAFSARNSSKDTENAIRLHMLNAIRKQATKIKKELRKTVATWETKPKFETDVGYTRGRVVTKGERFPNMARARAEARVYTTDPVWIILNAGAEYRYRVMQEGFQSKTVAHQLSSRPGEGVALRAWSHKSSFAERGIAPRGWTNAWRNENQAKIEKELAEEFEIALQKIEGKK